MGIYKKHFKEINIKNRIRNYYFDNLLKSKELEARNIIMDEQTIKIW